MDTTKIIAQYSQNSELQQAKFLSYLAHQITVFARDTYEVGGNSSLNPARLRGKNEIIHRITGQQFALLSNRSSRYPDDVFIKTIFEIAAACNIENDLNLSITSSFNHCGN